MTARILFVSGSIGLGHVTRDREIARALRAAVPDLDIQWLAAGEAAARLEEWGEDVLLESAVYNDGTEAAEAAASGFSLNLVDYFLKVRVPWKRNARIFAKVVDRLRPDLVVADEAYEIGIALAGDPDMLAGVPFVMIYDFMGFGATSKNPMDLIGCWWINRLWSRVNTELVTRGGASILFVGEELDVPDDGLGPFLPGRREQARDHFSFVGHVLTFDPAEYGDPAKAAALRAELGWDTDDDVIVVTAGGSAAGRQLLELALDAFPAVRRRRPRARMVVVAGPRIAAETLADRSEAGESAAPEGVEIHGFVPDLPRHLAACDLAVTQAGGTTVTELVALQKPFVYFPLEGHYEQEVCVAGRLERLGAGRRLSFKYTTAADFAVAMLEELGREPSYPLIPTDGAVRAAEQIDALLPSR